MARTHCRQTIVAACACSAHIAAPHASDIRACTHDSDPTFIAPCVAYQRLSRTATNGHTHTHTHTRKPPHPPTHPLRTHTGPTDTKTHAVTTSSVTMSDNLTPRSRKHSTVLVSFASSSAVFPSCSFGEHHRTGVRPVATPRSAYLSSQHPHFHHHRTTRQHLCPCKSCALV